MSKKCPHCGSYNTDPVYTNYVKRGVINAGRGALALGAAVVGKLFSGPTGTKLGVDTWRNTDPGEFYGHKCNSCNKEF